MNRTSSIQKVKLKKLLLEHTALGEIIQVSFSSFFLQALLSWESLSFLKYTSEVTNILLYFYYREENNNEIQTLVILLIFISYIIELSTCNSKKTLVPQDFLH